MLDKLTQQSQALWYTAADRVELRDVDMPPPKSGEVIVKAHFSGISRGTERLVFRGRVPSSEYRRMRCPHQDGEFPFPVKYGYALTGEIIGGPDEILRQRVFVLHPHQQILCVDASHIHLIPDGVPLKRAALVANMETAVNVLWDAGITPGERILIIGGGVLGLLIAGLAAQSSDNNVTVVDIDAARAREARLLGAKFAMPENAPGDQHVVIHTSATETGLKQALQCAAPDGRIIEASWFGDRAVSLSLGEAFHSRRLRLISSQVGAIPPSRRAQWTLAQRMQKALDHLEDPKFDALITGEINFGDAPMALPKVLADDSSGLMTVLSYP